eukprot:CAMPEP_0169121740 /NCGR_PEP_ID=MMETSP1015-20121227/32834_1 /TAXON_ID=342587 /ORGANISM="Karlodinium micrum, Strain CCMP2283" /LENGTH=498 /DNA_ID=CAMNT_0009184873 /DNA_START=8 /DNA_END=1501 /DNA_ORIENTATION=+
MKTLKDIPRAHYVDSFMGIIPDLMKNMHRRHEFLLDMTRGMPVCKATLGPKFDPECVELSIKDPIVIKHFLKDNHENYTKGPSHSDLFWCTMRLWLGDGIFAARHGTDAEDRGKNWMKQRKIASNIFSKNNFNDNMNEVFVAKGKRLCDLLREPALEGRQVDMQAKFFQYTMDSIMQIFFGERADTMGGEANEYAQAFDVAHRCLVDYFFKAIPPLTILRLLPWPFGGYQGLASLMHRSMHPLYREFAEAYKVLDVESRRIIQACRKDSKLKERKDLVALFIQAEENPNSMSNAWLRDVILNFIIAGRDTTACTLSWMFYILATHPEIQKQLQEEIDKKFAVGSSPTVRSVSASEMPYLNAVLYETLRLYPPVPIDGKMTVADDTLPNGMKVPADVKMTFLVYVMGRDPSVYPEPDTVKPARWIPFKEPAPHEFPVFQAGPRICLGMNMAVFEAKIAAIMILQKYFFEMSPGEAEKITYLPTALTMSICNTKSGDAPH